MNLINNMCICVLLLFLSGCVYEAPGGGKRIDYEKDDCEPSWYRDKGEKRNMVYGTGYAESYDRDMAGQLAGDQARNDAIKQIQTYISQNQDKIVKEVFTAAGGTQHKRAEGLVKQRLQTSIENTACNGCVIENFEDCKVGYEWGAYTRVRVNMDDYEGEFSKEVQAILEDVEEKLEQELE